MLTDAGKRRGQGSRQGTQANERQLQLTLPIARALGYIRPKLPRIDGVGDRGHFAGVQGGTEYQVFSAEPLGGVCGTRCHYNGKASGSYQV